MNHIENNPIGVFDSGIGGLTVASALHRRLPAEDIIYLGDTARVPYGTKSERAVRRYALECALFLLNRGVKLLVTACNTVSAIALPALKETLRVPIIGVVDPGVSAALKTSESMRIGVIGTPSTIASGAYQSRLREIDSGVTVWSKACPLLVPLAEEGMLDGDVVNMILRNYLKPLKKIRIDTLILGCTHYPLFIPAIHTLLGETISLVDSAEAVAETVEDVILREGMLNTHGSGRIHCYVTDIPRRFTTMGRLFFGGSLDKVRRVMIEDVK